MPASPSYSSHRSLPDLSPLGVSTTISDRLIKAPWLRGGVITVKVSLDDHSGAHRQTPYDTLALCRPSYGLPGLGNTSNVRHCHTDHYRTTCCDINQSDRSLSPAHCAFQVGPLRLMAILCMTALLQIHDADPHLKPLSRLSLKNPATPLATVP